MGEILQNLGLGGGTQQPDLLAAFRPDVGGTAGPGGITGPLTSPPLNNAIATGEGPPALAAPEDAVTVTGWGPKKPTILGAIADAYLMSQGGKPMFSIQRDQRNMTDAMRGFTNDPQEAVRRIGMIPGHQKDAWDMYNQQQDNARGDLVAGANADAKKEKYLTRIGGMLNRIRNAKDPATAYKNNLPYIRQYAAARGLEQELAALGDEYNEDSVGNFIEGGVSPEDQLKMAATNEYRNARLGQMQQTIDNTQDYRTERLEDFDIQEAGRNTRSKVAEEGRNNRSKTGGKGREPRFVKTEKGIMELSPSGHTGRIDKGDVIEVWIRVAPNKWERAQTLPKKGK